MGKKVDLCATESRVKVVSFEVTVDYDLALEKRSVRFGCFNPNLTDDHFSKVVGKGKVEVEAFAVNFGGYVSSEEAVAHLAQMGKRPGIPLELADVSISLSNSEALGARMSLVALGDSWQDPGGSQYVASLDDVAAGRLLYLGLWDGRWGGHWWFLAF